MRFQVGDGKQRLQDFVLDGGVVVGQRVVVAFIKLGFASPSLPHLFDQAANFATFSSVDVQFVDALFSEAISPLCESFGALIGGNDAQAGVVGDGSPELHWDSAGTLVPVWARRQAPVFSAFQEALHVAAVNCSSPR
jgi:hypothetical protein